MNDACLTFASAGSNMRTSVTHVRATSLLAIPLRLIRVTALIAAISCTSNELLDSELDPGSGIAVSASASTVTLTTDQSSADRGSTIRVVPRDAGAKLIGPGAAVALHVEGDAAAAGFGPITYVAADSSYRATFLPSASGSAVIIRATVNGTTLNAIAAPAARKLPQQGFSFCSNTGEVCNFIGRRDVRLATESGESYTQEFYGSVPCAPTGYERGFTGAPDAAYTYCEIGTRKTRDVINVTARMAGLDAATLQVPLGDTGVTRELVRAGGLPGPPSGEGSFRMICQLAKMEFFDPIAFPGVENSSHLHMYFGNVDVTPSSTSATLTRSGRGSCSGGTVNRTGYWVPAVFHSKTSEIIPPDFATIYYKTGYNVDPATVREIPAGLVMIAGDKSNFGKPQIINKLEVASWGCEKTTWSNTGAVPDCPAGDVVTLSINFPQCWDGVRLDSPDHQSHMAYPDYRNPPERSTCPASHPVMLPIITEILHWPVIPSMETKFWRLTSDMYSLSARGGYSAHADWMNGWSQEHFRTIVTRCLQPGRDCQVNLLGDGRALF